MKFLWNIIFVGFATSPVLAADTVSPLDDLTRAYQREILFLSTYRKELNSKIESVRTSLGGNLKSAKTELDGLEHQWLKLQTNNELLLQTLTDIERDFENKKENKDLLETTIKQASLETGKEGKESKISLIDQISQVYEVAVTDLKQTGAIQTSQGVFYSKDGEQQSGNIIKLGSVARFAETQGKIAALYPAGGGSFRVWKWLSADAAPLLEQSTPKNLEFFLYDNPDKEFVAQNEKTTLDVLKSGGAIGWVIVVMGLFALAISGIRFYLLERAKNSDDSLLDGVISKIKGDQVEEARHVLLQQDNAVCRVVNNTISYLQSEPNKVEDAIVESIIKESQVIDRFGVVILVIASVAPLMGLLGTVTGMISTFDIITLYGTGNPALLSGGISEALVTTMLGLLVAIPALLIGQFLGARNEKIKSDMEKWALAACNAFKNREVPS